MTRKRGMMIRYLLLATAGFAAAWVPGSGAKAQGVETFAGSSASASADTGDSADTESANDLDNEAIIITGRAARLYRAEEITSGKLPADPLASSQVINIVTEQLIEDQGARDAQDL